MVTRQFFAGRVEGAAENKPIDIKTWLLDCILVFHITFMYQISPDQDLVTMTFPSRSQAGVQVHFISETPTRSEMFSKQSVTWC